MPDPYQNLLNFINLEKLFFKEFYPAINWDNNKWPMHIIFPNWKRSKTTNISFTPITKGGLKIDGFNNPSIKEIIPKNINDTIKAILSFIIRTKNIQANSATTYQLVLLGLYHVMFSRNEKEFMNINNDYFNFLEIYYKKHYDPNNAYNICQYLSYIGKLFDKHRLSTKKIMYTPRLKRGRNPHNTPKKFREDGPHEKELTREAIEALAVILNSPDSE
ncbi:MAG: hypothetical protein MK132_17410 [Lentisphaerales bacterium]|nr:hypothetical protein [Lentisphaerales bacterium]